MTALHYRVYHRGTPEQHSKPTAYNFDLEPIVFDRAPSREMAVRDAEEMRDGVSECLREIGLEPNWHYGSAWPCQQLQEAIGALKSENEDLEERLHLRPGRLELAWAKMHPEAAAEYKRRREFRS
jgi:hypothetical protein